MKKLLILIPLALAYVMLYAAIPSPQNITLLWDYPSPSTNVTFLLYTSTTMTAPRPWPLLKVIPGTNLSTTINVIPGEAYYYLTATNFWGESDPSNVAGTPALPASGVLSVRRGP